MFLLLQLGVFLLLRSSLFHSHPNVSTIDLCQSWKRSKEAVMRATSNGFAMQVRIKEFTQMEINSNS